MADRASSSSTYLLVPILLIAVLLGTAVIRGPNLVSLSGFGSAIIVAAPLILATYALMALAVAGRGTVDLAMGPLVPCADRDQPCDPAAAGRDGAGIHVVLGLGADDLLTGAADPCHRDRGVASVHADALLRKPAHDGV
ncbi:MAG: hypothetical protein LW715_16155 [Rhodobacter sp.]|nr:hypothetical protein [Rhodobacter sp.]